MTIQVSTKVCSFGKQVGALNKLQSLEMKYLFQSNWNWPYSGGGEGRDRIFSPRGRPVRLQAGPQPHVRVHGQLHQEAQEPAGEVHDEQCVGKLHNSAGLKFAHFPILEICVKHYLTLFCPGYHQQGDTRNVAMHCLRFWGAKDYRFLTLTLKMKWERVLFRGWQVSTSEHGAQHHIYRLVKDWGWQPTARLPGRG